MWLIRRGRCTASANRRWLYRREVLEKAGLIQRFRDGSTHYIQLRTPALEKAAGWLEFYRQSWSVELEQLESLLGRPGVKSPKKRARRRS